MADDGTNQPLFGSNPSVSPDAMRLRREMAAKMAMQGMDTSPIRSPWQGAARMAQALVSGLEMNRLDKSEREARQNAKSEMLDAYQNKNFAPLLSDPWVTPEQMRGALETTLPKYLDANTHYQPVNPSTGQPSGPAIPKNPNVTYSTEGASYTGPGGYPQQNQPPQAPPRAPQAGGGNGGAFGVPMPPARPPQAPPQAAAPGATFDQRFNASFPQLDQLAGVGRDIKSAKVTRDANDAARAADMAELDHSSEQLKRLGIIKDIFRPGKEPVTGLAGEPLQRLQEAYTGITGRNDLGDPSGAEGAYKMNLALAAEAAKGLKGTNTDLVTYLQGMPGNIMYSPKGTRALVSILEQQYRRGAEIGKFAATTKNYDTYIADKQKRLSAMPVMSPFSNRMLDDELADSGKQGGPSNQGWSIKYR